MIVCRGLGTSKALLATAGLGRWAASVVTVVSDWLVRARRRRA